MEKDPPRAPITSEDMKADESQTRVDADIALIQGERGFCLSVCLSVVLSLSLKDHDL